MVTQLSTGNSLLQLNVPDELRGRLMSLFGLIVMGFAPVGCIIYGRWLTIPVRARPLPGSLFAALAAGLVLLRYPDLRRLDFSDLGPPEAAPHAANHFPALINPGHFPIEATAMVGWALRSAPAPHCYCRMNAL